MNCEHCKKELKPARAFFDGEPTFVGLVPCACQRPIMTENGVVRPGTPEHKKLLQTGRYSINDILEEEDRSISIDQYMNLNPHLDPHEL